MMGEDEPTDYSALRNFQLYDAQSSLNSQHLLDQQSCGNPLCAKGMEYAELTILLLSSKIVDNYCQYYTRIRRA